MKKLIFLTGLLTLSFGVLSCEKENNPGEELMGTWYMPQPLNRHTAGKSVTDVGEHSLSAWNYSQIVTTNSDQELIDRMAEAKGAITLSGAVNEDIKYMHGWVDNNSGQAGVSLSNYNWYQFDKMPSDPMISAYMDNFSHQYVDSIVVIWNDSTGSYDTLYNQHYYTDYLGVYYEDGRYMELNDEFDFTFDGKELNIPTQSFILDDGQSLDFGGTLSYATIFVPANTPTEIFSNKGETSWDYGTWSITIEDGGRWVETYTWEDPYDSSGWNNSYIDSTVAEWEVSGDTIFVTYRFTDVWFSGNDFFGAGQGTWLYQIAYVYEKSGDNLTLTNEWELCDGEHNCLEWVEWEFGIDPGSLEEIKYVWTLEFSKTPPTRSKEFRGPFRAVIGKFPPYSLMK